MLCFFGIGAGFGSSGGCRPLRNLTCYDYFHGKDLEEQEMFNPSIALHLLAKNKKLSGDSHLIHLVAASTSSQDSTIGDLQAMEAKGCHP